VERKRASRVFGRRPFRSSEFRNFKFSGSPPPSSSFSLYSLLRRQLTVSFYSNVNRQKWKDGIEVKERLKGRREGSEGARVISQRPCSIIENSGTHWLREIPKKNSPSFPRLPTLSSLHLRFCSSSQTLSQLAFTH